MSATIAEWERQFPAGDSIIARVSNHALLHDCLLYRPTGEQSALIFVSGSGDTHYLEAADLAVLLQECGASDASIPEADAKDDVQVRLAQLRRLGLVRQSDEGQS